MTARDTCAIAGPYVGTACQRMAYQWWSWSYWRIKFAATVMGVLAGCGGSVGPDPGTVVHDAGVADAPAMDQDPSCPPITQQPMAPHACRRHQADEAVLDSGTVAIVVTCWEPTGDPRFDGGLEPVPCGGGR